MRGEETPLRNAIFTVTCLLRRIIVIAGCPIISRALSATCVSETAAAHSTLTIKARARTSAAISCETIARVFIFITGHIAITASTLVYWSAKKIFVHNRLYCTEFLRCLFYIPV